MIISIMRLILKNVADIAVNIGPHTEKKNANTVLHIGKETANTNPYIVQSIAKNFVKLLVNIGLHILEDNMNTIACIVPHILNNFLRQRLLNVRDGVGV